MSRRAYPARRSTRGVYRQSSRVPYLWAQVRREPSWSSGAVDATFSTVAGDATADGGSSAFTGDAFFETVAGDSTAEGGTSTFSGTGDATFSTVAGDASADGESTSFIGAGTFSTTAGDATGDGGVSSFAGAGTFATAGGDATGDGGSTSFTGTGSFSTSEGTATGDGGSTDLTGSATFTTLVGVATADGGVTTATGDALFVTIDVDASADGGSSAFAGGATFSTETGAATASGSPSSVRNITATIQLVEAFAVAIVESDYDLSLLPGAWVAALVEAALNRESVEYVRVQVTADVTLADDVPVEFAIVAAHARPGSGDWQDAAWADDEATTREARLLVDAGDLGVGANRVFVRLTDSPEVPVLGPLALVVS